MGRAGTDGLRTRRLLPIAPLRICRGGWSADVCWETVLLGRAYGGDDVF